MLLSIITPTFNSETTLEECILSIFNNLSIQYEHIIIDGKSTDSTIEIINKYPHLKWTSEPDKGIYDAINKGIKRSTGKWIYVLGCDDIIQADFFNNELTNIQDEVDMIYGNVILKHSKKKYDGKYDIKKLLRSNICQQAIIYKHNIFEKKGYLQQKYPIAADYILNISLFADINLQKTYTESIIAIHDDTGISSNTNDVQAKLDKIDVFCKELNIHWYNDFFTDYLKYDGILQIQNGRFLKGMFRLSYALLKASNSQ